jgi:hypothetical protein
MLDSIKPDLATTVAFLREKRSNGPWCLTAIVPDGPLYSATFTDADKARAWLAKHAGTANLHYSPNLVRKATGKGGRVRKADVEMLEFVHADIDVDKADSLGDISLDERKTVVLDQLQAWDAPTLAVDSGGGLQGLWRLSQPLPATDENITAVEAMNRYMAMQYPGGEPQCANVDHLLRLPGTINHPDAGKRKRGRVTAPTRLVRRGSEAYPSKAFGRAEAPPKAKVDVTFGAPEQVDIDALGLPDDLLSIVRNGEGDKPKPGDNSRSSWLFVGVLQMLRHGVAPEQILWLLINPEFGISSSVLDPKEGHRTDAQQLAYAERQVRNAIAVVEGERQADMKELGDIDPEVLKPEVPADWEAWFQQNWSPIGQRDIASIPPTPWVVDGILLENDVTTIGGRGGSGKSLFAWSLAIMVATGKRFAWWTPPAKPRRVLIISGEDDVNEVERRVAVACKAMGLDRAELGDNFLVWSHRNIRLAEKDPKTGKAVKTKLWHGVRWAIEKLGVGVVMLDPVIKGGVGFDQSSNDDMDAFYAVLREVTLGFPCAVLTIDHFAKGGVGGDQASIRGASAKVDASRVAATLTTMTENEYDKLRPPRPRESYVLFVDPKQNYARKTGGHWMELVEHDVGNGEKRPALVWRDLDRMDGLVDPQRWQHRAAFLRLISDGRTDLEHEGWPWGTSNSGKVDARLDAAVATLFDVTLVQARQWIDAFAAEGSIVASDWTSPNRNKTKVWMRSENYTSDEDAETEAMRE